MIIEGVITTTDRSGEVNVAPMGPVVEEGGTDFTTFLLRPYRTSRTYQNLRQIPEGVFHVTDDVELIARAVVEKPRPPLRRAESVRGWILSDACRYWEFRVAAIDDRQERTSIHARVTRTGRLRDFLGFNRARHAVVEAAILASRIGLLPADEILGEFRRLEVLVRKTGGERERRSFGLLEQHVTEAARRVAGSETVRVRTGSRLHFGLLAPWAGLGRRHGGVGMMVRDPGIDLTARPAPELTVTGSLSERVEVIARAALERIRAGSLESRRANDTGGARITIDASPPEHTGLGTGTQLTLATVTALEQLLRGARGPVIERARQAGRGRRSAIGIHGFEHGGLIVDGGHGGPEIDAGGPAPLLTRLEVPADWSVLLVVPRAERGLSGRRERAAFRALEENGTGARERSADLCLEILLSLLPALSEGNFPVFSRAMGEFERKVGAIFAATQGGIFASPATQALVDFLRRQGIEGVGQSSWGPAVYGFVDDADRARSLAQRVAERFRLAGDEVIVTAPLNRGALVLWERATRGR